MTNSNSMNWYKQSKSNKVLYIARGVSGSGKSTMSKGLSDNIYSTDDYFMKDGEYQFDPKQLGKAHEWNRQRVEKAMEEGITPIVVDNTNTMFWEFRDYVKMGMRYGYKIEFKEPDWHPDLYTPEGKWNIDFLKGRNEHGVPDEALQKMIDRYEYNPTVEDVLKSKAPWEK